MTETCPRCKAMGDRIIKRVCELVIEALGIEDGIKMLDEIMKEKNPNGPGVINSMKQCRYCRYFSLPMNCAPCKTCGKKTNWKNFAAADKYEGIFKSRGG